MSSDGLKMTMTTLTCNFKLKIESREQNRGGPINYHRDKDTRTDEETGKTCPN